MPEILIRNFKQGLDTRREVLSSLPGTLQNLVNAHINQGGEIEKRYAFVRTALPANTFGLESTSSGLITFGSAADPGGWPRGPVTGYQRLQHPALSEVFWSPVYDADKHDMTEVKWSYSHLGKAWVAAKFTDGNTFLFYDGSVVLHSRNGLILSGAASQPFINLQVLDGITKGFNTIDGFSAFSGVVSGYFLDTGSNFVEGTVYSAATQVFSVVTTVDSSGEIATLELPGTAATVGSASTATFTVAGSGTSAYTIYAPLELDSSFSVLLNSGAPTAWATTNDATATAIAAAINAWTAVTGYSAAAVGAVVTVSAPIPVGDSAESYNQGTLQVVAVDDATANGNKAFGNGGKAVTEKEQGLAYAVNGSWAEGDTWTMEVVVGEQTYTLGAGNITGSDFAWGYVHKQRGYVANGTQFNFSSVGDITLWEQQNLGAGFVVFQTQFGQEDGVQAFADYQGRLAVFGRRSVQIWSTDADPTQFALVQTLTNYGTVAPGSVHSLGELETFFLSDSGVRSLRARQTTLNAFVEDLGSPIDGIIQEVLNGMTDDEKADAVGVIEPTRGSYWLFLDDTLYVLSYFPSAKIVAWSKYETTYNNGTACQITNNTGATRSYFVGLENDVKRAQQTFSLANGAAQSIWFPAKYIWSAVGAADPVLATTLTDGFVGSLNHTAEAVVAATSAHTSFVPYKFVVHDGQVFARDTDAAYAYGGSNKVTFDTSIAFVELPWLDHDKPTLQKSFSEIDVGIAGKWLVETGVDPYSAGMEVTLVDGDAATPSNAKDSSFDKQTISFNANGSHMKFKARSTSNNVGLAKLSTLVAKYM